jgi:hypothetical protein
MAIARNGLSILAACLISANANAACTKGSEFEPPSCSLKLPVIKAVVITANAARSKLDTSNSDCRSFVLDEPKVLAFFHSARRVEKHDALHALDWSPCYASGELRFGDGTGARWQVTQSGQGTLVRGDEEITVFCRTCRHPPFQE